jgi:hypothetical protein
VIILLSYFEHDHNKNWAFVMASTERANGGCLFWDVAQRKKTLEELKSEAIAELERRGYGVHGKTPAQIRQILRRRPTKQKSDTPNPQDQSPRAKA